MFFLLIHDPSSISIAFSPSPPKLPLLLSLLLSLRWWWYWWYYLKENKHPSDHVVWDFGKTLMEEWYFPSISLCDLTYLQHSSWFFFYEMSLYLCVLELGIILEQTPCARWQDVWRTEGIKRTYFLLQFPVHIPTKNCSTFTSSTPRRRKIKQDGYRKWVSLHPSTSLSSSLLLLLSHAHRDYSSVG